MKIESGRVIFSSGRSRSGNCGIVGIGPEGMSISYGYDGILWEPHEGEWQDDPLSNEDLKELADYMISRWSGWRNALNTRDVQT